MKYFWIFLVAFLFFCCKKEVEPFSPVTGLEESNIEIGKKIFNGKGQCATCHKISQNVLGPSVAEVVSAYENSKSDMIKFLKGNADPIVDPSQFPIMKVNLEITKKMTDKELQSLIDYMNHIAKK